MIKFLETIYNTWKARRALIHDSAKKALNCQLDVVHFTEKVASLREDMQQFSAEVLEKVEKLYEARKDAPDTIEIPTDPTEASALNHVLAVKGAEEFLAKKAGEASYYLKNITQLKNL